MDTPLRILLIDDNPDDRLLVIRELNKKFSDIEVEQIIDMDEFNQALKAGNFDLAITDYQLHWSTGLVILRSIKTRYPDKPVIMFTATGSEEIAVAAMKAGLDDYVLKTPKHFGRLPASIEQCFEQFEERKRLEEAKEAYKTVFENIPMGIYRTSPEGEIIDVNDVIVDLLGYTDRKSLLKKNVRETYANPEDRVKLEALIKEKGKVEDYPISLRKKNGDIVEVKISTSAVLDEEGKIKYYVGTMYQES